MDAELGFTLTNALAFVGFICLVVSLFVHGGARRTLRLLGSRVIPIVLSVVYVGLLFGSFGNQPEGGGLTSLEGLRISFGTDALLLLGWVHYLAFDLFVEQWEVQDGESRGVPNWALIISMVLTFVAGPFGLLTYFGLRAATTRTGPLAMDLRSAESTQG